MPVTPRLLLATALVGLSLLPTSSAATFAADRAGAAGPAGRVSAQATDTQFVGRDISWPNCPKGMGIPARRTLGLPMPSSSTKLVVIGLTNGPGFYPNPCLASQVKWAKSHHTYTAAYAFLTYPTSAQLKKYATKGPYEGTSTTTKLRNSGYAEAAFNVASMKKAGLDAPFVWVDVEPSRAPAPWSSSQTKNKAVLDGALAGYRDAGLKVGVYSTSYLWREIVGSAEYGLPEWRTVGKASKSTALKMCAKSSFQGGGAVLAQWWTSDSDFDVTCPGYGTKTKLKKYYVKH